MNLLGFFFSPLVKQCYISYFNRHINNVFFFSFPLLFRLTSVLFFFRLRQPTFSSARMLCELAPIKLVPAAWSLRRRLLHPMPHYCLGMLMYNIFPLQFFFFFLVLEHRIDHHNNNSLFLLVFFFFFVFSFGKQEGSSAPSDIYLTLYRGKNRSRRRGSHPWKRGNKHPSGPPSFFSCLASISLSSLALFATFISHLCIPSSFSFLFTTLPEKPHTREVITSGHPTGRAQSNNKKREFEREVVDLLSEINEKKGGRE